MRLPCSAHPSERYPMNKYGHSARRQARIAIKRYRATQNRVLELEATLRQLGPYTRYEHFAQTIGSPEDAAARILRCLEHPNIEVEGFRAFFAPALLHISSDATFGQVALLILEYCELRGLTQQFTKLLNEQCLEALEELKSEASVKTLTEDSLLEATVYA